MKKRDAKEIVDDLVAEMAWRMDHGHAMKTLDLFCEELQFGIEGALQGRDGLAAQLAARETASYDARHIYTNSRIVSYDADVIEATVVAVIYKIEAGEETPITTILCADYSMRLQQEGGQWRFKAIIVKPVIAPKS